MLAWGGLGGYKNNFKLLIGPEWGEGDRNQPPRLTDGIAIASRLVVLLAEKFPAVTNCYIWAQSSRVCTLSISSFGWQSPLIYSWPFCEKKKTDKTVFGHTLAQKYLRESLEYAELQSLVGSTVVQILRAETEARRGDTVLIKSSEERMSHLFSLCVWIKCSQFFEIKLPD